MSGRVLIRSVSAVKVGRFKMSSGVVRQSRWESARYDELWSDLAVMVWRVEIWFVRVWQSRRVRVV